MSSSNGGIQAGQAGGTEITLSVMQAGEKTWPHLLFKFLFPGIEVPHGVACKQGRFKFAQQGADLVWIGARMNFDDVLCQFRHRQMCWQSEAAVDKETQDLAPVIRILFFIGAANTKPQTCGTRQAAANYTTYTVQVALWGQAHQHRLQVPMQRLTDGAQPLPEPAPGTPQARRQPGPETAQQEGNGQQA